MTKQPLFKIIYSRKYRAMGARYHGRHCVVVQSALRGRNTLVRLRGGELAIVPRGNLILVDSGTRTPHLAVGAGYSITTERDTNWLPEVCYSAQVRRDWGY